MSHSGSGDLSAVHHHPHPHRRLFPLPFFTPIGRSPSRSARVRYKRKMQREVIAVTNRCILTLNRMYSNHTPLPPQDCNLTSMHPHINQHASNMYSMHPSCTMPTCASPASYQSCNNFDVTRHSFSRYQPDNISSTSSCARRQSPCDFHTSSTRVRMPSHASCARLPWLLGSTLCLLSAGRSAVRRDRFKSKPCRSASE